MSDRVDFLTSNWNRVYKCMMAAELIGDDRVIVLADMEDESGRVFATSFDSVAGDTGWSSEAAWVGHLGRRLLADLLSVAWPEVPATISVLRSSGWDGSQSCILVISGGGVQFRFCRPLEHSHP